MPVLGDGMKSQKFTSSGSVTALPNGSLYCMGFTVGMDGVNDPVVTIYNGADNTGEEIVPTATYDASALNLRGVVKSAGVKCSAGIYVEITCAGTVEVVVDYDNRPDGLGF